MTDKFRSRLELHSVINGVSARQVLAAASEVRVKETLNGQYMVTFTYPRLPDDKERYDALVEENEVRFPDGIERGQHFVIKSVNEERRGLRVYKHVEAHHVAFKLGQYFLDDYIDFAAAQPPESLLAMIGNDTPYTMMIEGSFTPQDVFEFGEKRKHDLLSEVKTLYNGDLTYDNYAIKLTTRAGANHGVEIRYRKNLAGITRKSQSMERVTRLYGYGKNGLTIEGHAGHTVKYIDSPYFDPDNPLMERIDFPEIEDQAALLDAMQRHLKTVELPKVAYEIDFIEMEKVNAEFRAEAIRDIGDTVTVIDESMGYRFDARVTDYERYPFEPKRGRIVLANFRELTTGDYLFRATVASRKAMVYTSENAVLKGQKYDDSITLVDGLGMRVSDDHDRTMLRFGQTGPGEYGMAMYNKAGARTIWQDASTGNAYFSGTLQAANGSFTGSITALSGTIGGWSINTGSLSGTGQILGGSIIGSFISGGSVIGAYFATSTSYPRVEASNTLQLFRASASVTNFAEIASSGPSLAPEFHATNGIRRVRLGVSVGGAYADSGLYSQGDFEIAAPSTYFTGSLYVPTWNHLSTAIGEQTLAQALASKADKSGVFGSINVGTATLHISNGVITAIT
ncbi:phage tail spike protein [Paenibacillus sp. CAU 1782]